jgi:acyl-CoA thioesterase-2
MDRRLADLLRLLELERLELNLFRGESRDIGSPQVFGGQVLGQALMAASGTVEGRIVHSLHAYFLRPGDFDAPIVYHVDRARDGSSFTSRRVTAIQHGEQIFNMAASFQVQQPGLEHQIAMPEVPPPEALRDLTGYIDEVREHLPARLRRPVTHQRPFEFRPVQPPDYLTPTARPPAKQLWFRAVDRAPDGEALHRCLLAYVSDYHLLDTTLLPHAMSWLNAGIRMASIDHAMWFHAPVRADEWLLYALDSPSAAGARGFTRGSIFTREGKLVASTAQEGLIRVAREGK